MEGQTQEHSGKKQQFDIKGSRPQSSVRNQLPLQAEGEKQKAKETDASMDTQSNAMSEKDQTRVVELAYKLYEQRGRKDGAGSGGLVQAERRIMSQGRLSSSSL